MSSFFYLVLQGILTDISSSGHKQREEGRLCPCITLLPPLHHMFHLSPRFTQHVIATRAIFSAAEPQQGAVH